MEQTKPGGLTKLVIGILAFLGVYLLLASFWYQDTLAAVEHLNGAVVKVTKADNDPGDSAKLTLYLSPNRSSRYTLGVTPSHPDWMLFRLPHFRNGLATVKVRQVVTLYELLTWSGPDQLLEVRLLPFGMNVPD